MRRVFVGAQLLGSATERRAAASALAIRSDVEIAKELSADHDRHPLGAPDSAPPCVPAPPTGTTAWPHTTSSPSSSTARRPRS
ncbi:hypothetical protein O1L55_41050 [Streptomyces albulus]|nr:hypothetical protein [Streptomyces noursei]